MKDAPQQQSSKKQSFAADPNIGRTIGPCLIQRRLGKGGMGTVYLASHLTLNKPVALKLLRNDLPTDQQGLELFLREARAAARLDHPRIVTVYDAGGQDDTYYIVMQYVAGESLAIRLKREQRLSLEESLRIFRAVAEGMQHAHGHGIVHRDIKPDNILLDANGGVKIVDFGLAYAIETDAKKAASATVMGSPNFMSPEQARGEPLDARTDVYSLGATLYRMMTGVPPFQASTSMAVICKVVNESLRPPHEVNAVIPPTISRFVCRLMEKDRDARIATMAQAIEELDGLERKARRPQRRRLPRIPRKALVAGAAAICATLLGGVFWLFLATGKPGDAAAFQSSGSVGTAPGGMTLPPAPPGSALSPHDLERLTKRFEEFKKAVTAGKLFELKALLDPELRRGPDVPVRLRPAMVIQRIVTDLGRGDWTRASILRCYWDNEARGIAALEAAVPGDGQRHELAWILRQGEWYLAPPRVLGQLENDSAQSR